MTASPRFAEYIAAALINSAEQRGGTISIRIETLHEILSSDFGLKLDDEELAGAIRILNRCNVSYIADDEYAGRFVTISRDRFDDFLDKAAKEQKDYENQLLELDDEPGSIADIFAKRSMEKFRNYESYERYAGLRNYAQFGSDWVASAIEGLKSSRLGEERVPAADRVVSLDHNLPEYREISDGIERVIEEWRGDNSAEVGAETRDRIRQSLQSAQALWQATELKAIQIKVGILMALEDARDVLVDVGKGLTIAALVTTIKTFVRNVVGIDLDKL